jgi:hypothetical protein
MKRALPVVIETLHSLGMALWLGGIVALWIAALPPTEELAGLRRLSGLIEFAGILMIGAQFLLRRRYLGNRRLFIGDGARQLLTFAALFLAEMCRYNLFPVMDSALASGKMEDFSRLRFFYLMIAVVEVLMLVGVAALTSWLNLPRPTLQTAAAPPPEPDASASS